MSALLIAGARLFDPASGLDAVGDLLIVEGQVAGVGEVPRRGDEQVIEAAGLWALPGLMDLHVHLREPGQEQKETIATGATAAAAGGLTTIVAEPNTVPPRDTAARIAEAQRLSAHAPVRVLHKGAITVGQEGHEVTDLAALRAAGAAAASDDGRSVYDNEVMRRAFAIARVAKLPLTVHVDETTLMARDIALAAQTGWPVHFSHVSLEEEVVLIRTAQQRGLHVTGEATPHHLVLCADDVAADDTNAKMNPPLRSRRDREALRTALAAGVITVIASDHAPHTVEEKSRPYAEAPSGVIGLETALGVVWAELVPASGGPMAARIVRAMTQAPAAVLGQEAPRLRVGARADVTLLDPAHRWTVDPSAFQSKGRNCPFAGRPLRGKAVGTIVEGRIAMREGEVFAAADRDGVTL